MRARTKLACVGALALPMAACSASGLDELAGDPPGSSGAGAITGAAGAAAGGSPAAGASSGGGGGSRAAGGSGSAGASGKGSGGFGATGGTSGAGAGSNNGAGAPQAGQSGNSSGGAAAGNGGTPAGSAGAPGSGGGNAGGGGAAAGSAGAAAGSAGAAGGMGGGPAPGRCGDGLVNRPDEQCDDANDLDNDACTTACKVRCPLGAAALAPQSNRCFFNLPVTGPSAPPDTFGSSDPLCAGPGVHIAMFADPRDVSWLSLVNAGGTPRAWVGARAIGAQDDSRDDFAWFEGGPIADVLWQATQPTPEKGEACVDLRPINEGGTFVFRVGDTYCDSVSTVNQVVCAREPVCRVKGRDGVVGAGGHCYVMGEKPTSRPEASAFCVDLGGHLATFETLSELTSLGGFGIRDVWVGATQLTPPFVGQSNVGGGWTWTDGPDAKAVVSPGLWHGLQEPNDGIAGKTADTGVEDCAEILGNTRRLNDTPCEGVNRALCEVE